MKRIPELFQRFLDRSVTRYDRLVLVFFLSFFVLFSSGRLDNFDPLAQLQAATALVNNGSLGVRFAPMPEEYHLWTQSGNGLYYEMHDIGGSLFMSPSAAVGSFRDHRP